MPMRALVKAETGVPGEDIRDVEPVPVIVGDEVQVGALALTYETTSTWTPSTCPVRAALRGRARVLASLTHQKFPPSIAGRGRESPPEIVPTTR